MRRNSEYVVIPFHNISHRDLEKRLNRYADENSYYVVSVTATVHENSKTTNVGHPDWIVVFRS